MDITTTSSSSSSSYSLQITVISAESLTMAGKNLFVAISAEESKQQVRTDTCKEDDVMISSSSYHAWNEKLVMDVPMHVKSVILDVRRATRSGEKSVGVARVPVSDFMGSSMPRDYLHFLSYRLRNRYGDPNGIINFSVKVLKLGLDYCDQKKLRDGKMGLAVEVSGWGCRENGMPKPWHGIGLVGDRTSSSQAVVGVPTTWYNNSCHHV